MSRQEQPSPARDFAPLFAVSLLVLTVLVFVPAHVYLVNRSAVKVFLRDVMGATGVAALVSTIGLSSLLLLVRPATRRRMTVLILGVSCLAWFHAYCLVWPYEVMDGADIAWADYAGRSLFDALLWIVVLPPLVWLAPRVYPRVGTICGGLLAIQLASLGISSARAYESPLDFFKHYYVESESAFDFSKNRNVIVIVLDEFQSDIFAEAILPIADYREHFSGFTYFPDTVAGFNFTEFAIPAILTGHIYDNSRPREHFLRSAYLQDSLPATLMQEGFETELYPWRGFANESIYYDDAVASNFKRRPRPLIEKLEDVARLVDLGLFRAAPQFAKRHIYNNADWLVSGLFGRARAGDASPNLAVPTAPDARRREITPSLTLDNVFLDFAKNRANPVGHRITASQDRDVFKFYHLAGLHVPVKLKRDFTYGTFDYTRANFSEQAEAYVRIVGAFLQELKRQGVYDRSMIVILGDHGSGRAPELHLNPTSPARTEQLNRTAIRNDFQRDKARGVPLLLVKRFGGGGEIKTSRAPASVVDVPATVRAELNIAHHPVYPLKERTDFHGVSLFDLPEDRPRVRYYGAMLWTAKKSDYVGPIALYRIEGSSWSDESWSLEKILERGP